MKFSIVCFVACLSVVAAQTFYRGFDGFSGDFGGPSAFGGLQGLGQIANVRDPRANTGPVVFPPAPAGTPESSGVVVGASGYGFVPPSGQNGYLSYSNFY